MKTSVQPDFYDHLTVLESFFDISDITCYQDLPPDWYVGVTDIVNSTRAIDNNNYKWVNILGASPIIGLLNESGVDSIPFTFGGDGCAICIPPELYETAYKVFSVSRQIGRNEFDLELRAAIIPVSVIREKGYSLKVAKFKVSKHYNQAVFSGDGLGYAEELLKTDKKTPFHVEESPGTSLSVDYSGLECRWQEISPRDKSVFTLMVQSNPEIDNERRAEIYNSVLGEMRQIFGFDDTTNPIPASGLDMNMRLSKLSGEIKFRTSGKSWIKRLLYILKIEFQIFLGKIFMKTGYKSSETDWGQYKKDMMVNNDHRKFDNMLRLVICGSDRQLQQLSEYLESAYMKGDLAYGLDHSETAMITCMVFAYHHEHIHFIDGSNGGYIRAAKAFKQRQKELLSRN